MVSKVASPGCWIWASVMLFLSISVFFVAKGPEKMKENSENNADVDERVSSKGEDNVYF